MNKIYKTERGLVLIINKLNGYFVGKTSFGKFLALTENELNSLQVVA